MFKKFLCLFSGLAFIFSLVGISLSASAASGPLSGGAWGRGGEVYFSPSIPKSVRNEIRRGQWRQEHPRLNPLQSANQRYRQGDIEGAKQYFHYWDITSRFRNAPATTTKSGLTPHSGTKLYTPKD